MKPIDPRLIRRSAPVRRHLLALVALGVATAGALVAQAWAASEVIASVFSGDTFGTAAAVLVGVLAARGLLTWAQSVTATRAAAQVKADLRRDLIADLHDPRRVGPTPPAARLSTLIGQGLDALDPYIGRFFPQVALAAVVPGVITVVMLLADIWAGVTVAVTVPLVIGFLVLIGLRTQDELGRRWRSVDRLARHFGDVLEGMVTLTGFGRDQRKGLAEVGDRHRSSTLRSLRLAFLSGVALDLFATLSVALVAVGVGLRVVHGDLDLATGLFVLLLAPEAFTPIRRLGASFHDSTAGAEVVDAVFEVLDHPRHPGRAEAPDPKNLDLHFDRVLVQFPGRTDPALDRWTGTIAHGQLTVVTGPSGCGKSTLLSLLTGQLIAEEGRVLAGTVDLASVDPQKWRRHLAWVPQVPAVIDGTVADNVRWGVAASDQQVQAALHDAGAADLVLDRRLVEQGDSVSAGQRRRLAVARALLRVRVAGASVVLLDEPTAGLDETREHQVLQSLRELGVTVVVVSHRAASIDLADRVIDLSEQASEVALTC